MKKTNQRDKKLPLVTTTVAKLTNRELAQVQGGTEGTNTSWRPPCTPNAG